MASNDSDEYSLWETDGKLNQPLAEVTVDSQPSRNAGKTHTFTEFPASAVDEEGDEEETGGDSSKLLGKKSAPIWSFDFYKELFDVDTAVVLSRIKGSLIPIPSSSFTRNYIGGRPDVYGPFWICATLVMTIAISANLVTLFNNYGTPGYHYSPEFHRLVIAVVVVYGYTFLIPLLIRGIQFCTRVQSTSSYLDILCLYGYSMFIFIPLSLLLLIPNCIVEWVLVAVASLLSGAVISLSLWPSMREESSKKGLIIVICVILLHFAFSLSFRLYFFGSINCTGATINNASTVAGTTNFSSTNPTTTTILTKPSSSA